MLIHLLVDYRTMKYAADEVIISFDCWQAGSKRKA